MHPNRHIHTGVCTHILTNTHIGFLLLHLDECQLDFRSTSVYSLDSFSATSSCYRIDLIPSCLINNAARQTEVTPLNFVEQRFLHTVSLWCDVSFITGAQLTFLLEEKRRLKAASNRWISFPGGTAADHVYHYWVEPIHKDKIRLD